MTAPYKIVLFDDCCHVFTSLDTGANWTQQSTPAGTLGDDWTDMYMAVNDNDYTTVALFNEAPHAGTYGGVTFDGQRGGVEIITGNPTTDPSGLAIHDYSYGTSDSGNYQEATSGAIGALGKTILIPPTFADSLTGTYPRLSTDTGATWSDVTGLPSGKVWSRACFGQGATVMYIHKAWVSVSDTGQIWKSTDSGATWTQLSGAPGFNPPTDQTAPGYSQNSLRLRCSQNGDIVAGCDWFGNFWISADGGTTWTETSFSSKLSTDTAHMQTGDMSMSLDGSTIIVGVTSSVSGSRRGYVYLSTDFGSTWQLLSPPNQSTKEIYNVAVTPDGVALVVVYINGSTTALVDVSVDQGITWSTKTATMAYAGIGGQPGTFVSAYILPTTSNANVNPSGTPNLDPLIGATYRRVSAFTTEAPAFVGWHRHDFGHARILQSIGVSSDTGGLLDHLDMVTKDASGNYYVEGMTQIFDEDDALTDGWFLDGAMVPDSAYADTVAGVDGVRFTGLWNLRTKSVTVCAFGLDLGDFTVDVNGTVFVPYGSGTTPSAFDYTTGGAGAYLFTSTYISDNVQADVPRNGGVYISSGYMPVVVGFTFTSDGQTLRPIAPEQTGTRAGPSFGDLRRSHYVKALLRNTIGIQFGTDFGSTLQQAKLADGTGTQPAPTQMYSGLWRETLNDDYTFDSMLSWRIVRPYPAQVISIGASIEGTDA